MGCNYKKLQYGPVPIEFTNVMSDLIDDKQAKKIKTEYHNYPQTKYIPHAGDYMDLKIKHKLFRLN